MIREQFWRGNAELNDNQDENGAGDRLTEGADNPKSDDPRRCVVPRGRMPSGGRSGRAQHVILSCEKGSPACLADISPTARRGCI
jgi:hypothetical protein